MRRREYLRFAVGAAGVAGVAGSALTAAGSDDDASPSTRPNAATASETVTVAPASAGTATGTETATESDDFGPLADITVSNSSHRFQTTEAVMEPSGRYAFASRLDGFYVVDCADPDNPEVVTTYTDIQSADDRAIGGFLDLKYNRDRLMLSTGSGGAFRGLALYDVSDPESPRPMKTYETGYTVHNADLHGGYAYLTTGEELDVVDVAADDPESVARWSVTDHDEAYADVSRSLRNLHDVYVQNGRAYLAYWDAGTWMLDVSDPTDPAYVGHVADYSVEELTALDGPKRSEYFFEPEGNDHYAQPNDDGTLLAVGGESWNIESDSLETDEPADEDQGGPSGVVLYDISDPADPTKHAEIEPPQPPEGETARRRGGFYTTSHNFEIVGDFLYSSWYRGGVKVHDISDPDNPEQLAHWMDGDRASMWTAQVGVPGEFFVGTSYVHPTESGGPGAFYTFPDPSENPATVTPSGEAVGLSTPTPTATDTPTTAPPTPSGDVTPTDSHTATQTATATANPAAGETDPAASDATGADTSSEGGPGLGVLSGLAALGIGAWRLHRDGTER